MDWQDPVPSPTTEPQPSNSPFLSVDEAALLLRCKKASVYRLSSEGFLTSCKRQVGRRVIFDRAKLIKLVNEGRLKPRKRPAKDGEIDVS